MFPRLYRHIERKKSFSKRGRDPMDPPKSLRKLNIQVKFKIYNLRSTFVPDLYSYKTFQNIKKTLVHIKSVVLLSTK